MKNLSYLNGVLTVIAICLLLLTLSATGIIPKATASTQSGYATVPVNADGSIKVKIDTQSIIKVNISQLSGDSIPVFRAGKKHRWHVFPVAVSNIVETHNE